MLDKWFPRILTLAVWAALAWAATYWTLQFTGAPSTAAVVSANTMPATGAEPVHVARLFGPAIDKVIDVSVAPVVDPGSRFVLLGVAANRSSAGVALLSIEGSAAKPYRVGSKIEDTYLLQSVTTRSATLAIAQTGASFTVQLSTGAPGAVSVPRIGPADAASAARRTS